MDTTSPKTKLTKELSNEQNPLLKDTKAKQQELKTPQKNISILKNSDNQEAKTSTISLQKEQPQIQKILKDFLVDIKDLNSDTIKNNIKNSGIFLESKLKDVKNPQVELKDTLNTLTKITEKSSLYPVKALGKQITTLLNNDILKNASNNTLSQPTQDNNRSLSTISKSVDNIIQTLKTAFNEGDVTTKKPFQDLLSKLQHQLEPKMLSKENFKLPSLQNTLSQLTPLLTQSSTSESKTLLDLLGKILNIDPKTSLDQLQSQKLPQELKSASDTLKATITKTDPIFSKESESIFNKLLTLNTPKKLSTTNNVKEIIKDDLKAVLLKASEEIGKSSISNKTEILKGIDKLSLQIDYYQLMSHLSNASALYLPFSWENLQEGSVELKKAQDDKFYCDIELKLKDYGELNIRLVLYEKNQLNIRINSDSEEFKKIIFENIALLRSALIDIQITPREIRVRELTKKVEDVAYEDHADDLKMGFEVKG